MGFFQDAFEKMEDKEAVYRELIMNADTPEAAAIRSEYYSKAAKYCAGNLQVGRNVKIINPQWVSFGHGVYIEDDVTIIARGPGGITFGGGNCIKCGVYLDTESPEEGYITIGEGTYIGKGTTLHGHRGLEIGDHCLLAQNITLTPFSHLFEDATQNIDTQGGKVKKVTIGRDTYIGMNSTILYSGDIGEGCVVGSASVVVKPLPPYSIAVGNPARVIRKRGEKKEEK